MDITVCVGSSCHLKYSKDIISIFERLINFNHIADKVVLKASFCMGQCTDKGVCVKFNNETFSIMPGRETEDFFNNHVMREIYN